VFLVDQKLSHHRHHRPWFFLRKENLVDLCMVKEELLQNVMRGWYEPRREK